MFDTFRPKYVFLLTLFLIWFTSMAVETASREDYLEIERRVDFQHLMLSLFVKGSAKRRP